MRWLVSVVSLGVGMDPWGEPALQAEEDLGWGLDPWGSTQPPGETGEEDLGWGLDPDG
jgi:hypothetical protein